MCRGLHKGVACGYPLSSGAGPGDTRWMRMVPLCTRYANATRDTDRKNSASTCVLLGFLISHAKGLPCHTCHKSSPSGIGSRGQPRGIRLNRLLFHRPRVRLGCRPTLGKVFAGHGCSSKREVTHCLLSKNPELYSLSSKPRSETLDCGLHEAWRGEFCRCFL